MRGGFGGGRLDPVDLGVGIVRRQLASGLVVRLVGTLVRVPTRFVCAPDPDDEGQLGPDAETGDVGRLLVPRFWASRRGLEPSMENRLSIDRGRG